MAADEETKGAGKLHGSGDGKPGDNRPGERRQKERRRTPVTIDLKAEDVRAVPASASTGSASAAAREASVKPEPALKPEPAAKAEFPAESTRASQPERPAAERPAGTQRTPVGARTFANLDDLTRRTAIAAVAGGVVALVLVIVLQSIGLLPAPGRSVANQAAEQARTAVEATAAVERQLTAIDAMVAGLPAMRSDIADLDQRTAALQAGSAELAAKTDLEGVVSMLGQLRQRVDALPPSATRTDLDGLAERIGRLEVSIAAGGGDSTGSDAAIASLATKLGDAETALRSLTERLAAAEAQMAVVGAPHPMAGGEAAVRAIAITALRRASEGSVPFSGEVDMVAALGVSSEEIALLRPFADRGVPARAVLTADFPAVADEILTATAGDNPDAGFFERFVGGLGGLVSIRPAGPIAGTDPPAIVSRMIAAAEKGDLATALAEREGLPTSGLEASAAWAASASDRVALDDLVERIARSLGINTG